MESFYVWSKFDHNVWIELIFNEKLYCRLTRYNQSYNFPILLSEQILPNSIFYGTFVPLLGYYCFKRFVIDRYLKSKKEEEEQSKADEINRTLNERKKEAKSYILLIDDSYDKIVKREKDKKGLIIEKAIYGELSACLLHENSDQLIAQDENAFDVTKAVQVMTRESDSSIHFYESSKSYLPGFYDTNVGGPKSLLIKYTFNDEHYRCVIGEHDPVQLPSTSHKLTNW